MMYHLAQINVARMLAPLTEAQIDREQQQDGAKRR